MTIADRLRALELSRDTHDLAFARQYTPYSNEQAVTALGTDGLLQMYMFAPDELSHARVFLEKWQPPRKSRVLDVGCGTGRFATLLCAWRSDLRFTLLGNSRSQLSWYDYERRLLGDMHDLPVRPGTFDAVLLSYVLGYGRVDLVFREAYRALKYGGQLVVYDLVSCNKYADEVLVTLGYRCYDAPRLTREARRAGLYTVRCHDTPPFLNPKLASAPPCLSEAQPRLFIWEKQ